MTARLHRNFASIALSNLLAPCFSLVLVLAIGRLQGVEVLGKYSLVMTVFIAGQTVAALGLPVVITREVAQNLAASGRYFLHAALLSGACLVPCVLAAAWGLGRLMSDHEVALALALTLFSFVPSAITQCGEAVLLAHERASDFVAINLAETMLRALAGTVLVLLGFGVVALAAMILVLRVVAATAYVVALRRRGVSVPAPLDPALFRELARYVPVTGTIPVANTIYARADMFLLSSLASWGEVGLYSAALRLVDLGRSLPPAYARALYPVLARLRAPEHGRWYAAEAKRGLRRVLVFSIPIALVLCGLAPPLITALFGTDLLPAARVLQVLAWTVVPLALAVTLAQMLFSADRQGVDLGVNAAGTVVSVTACALLIPPFGALGAAIAVVLATTVYAALEYAGVRIFVAAPGVASGLGRLAVVGVVAAACLPAFAVAGPIVATVAALAVYGAGAIATGVVDRGEVQRVLRAVRPRAARACGGPGEGRSGAVVWDAPERVTAAEDTCRAAGASMEEAAHHPAVRGIRGPKAATR